MGKGSFVKHQMKKGLEDGGEPEPEAGNKPVTLGPWGRSPHHFSRRGLTNICKDI